MTLPDIIGWVGNIFFIYGVWAIGERKISGFYFNFFGNLAYVLQGYMKGTSSLLFLSLLLMILNIRGIMKWQIKKPKFRTRLPRYLRDK